MTSKKDAGIKTKDVIKDTGTSLATVAGVVAATTGVAPALEVTIVVQLFNILFKNSVEWFAGSRERAASSYTTALLHGLGCASEDEAKALLEEKLKNDNVRQVIFDTVRRLLDTSDPEVAAALGKLAAQYVPEGKKPDRFFRAAARVLADLDAEECAALKTVVNLVAGREGAAFELHYDPGAAGELRQLTRRRSVPGKGALIEDQELLGDVPQAPVLFQLLATQRLGIALYAGTGILMQREDMQRLAALL